MVAADNEPWLIQLSSVITGENHLAGGIISKQPVLILFSVLTLLVILVPATVGFYFKSACKVDMIVFTRRVLTISLVALAVILLFSFIVNVLYLSVSPVSLVIVQCALLLVCDILQFGFLLMF